MPPQVRPQASTTFTLAASGLVLAWAGCRASPVRTAPTAVEPPSGAQLSVESSSVERVPDATFVGAKVCGQCHEREVELWRGSPHALSMQPATARSVLGDFDQRSTFRYFGVTSRFHRRGDDFFVRTEGADGQLADFRIRYTFGFYPLQQYLIEFPDGRLQALGIAWDSRPRERGGQRWFHLYPKDRVRAGETIHWTGIDQNWNHMCAECHSTNLRKNFDLAHDRFDTTWSEINVACEACHGPGSAHVAWAGTPAPRAPDHRLPIRLSHAARTSWPMGTLASSGVAVGERQETELCSRCHARRSQIAVAASSAAPFLDSYIPELLTTDRYYPDGRMQDEVFNYGSFLQSKMYRAGVNCNDCHEPHGLALRAEGNAVCTQCHRATTYDSAQHHFHKVGSAGSHCPECHMPVSTYMVVDRRHDHGFRIPRPDLTVRDGIPNACNDCHRRETPAWALAKLTQIFGHAPGGYQDYESILQSARQGTIGAASGLVELAGRPTAPAIARATALWELRRYLGPQAVQSLKVALADPEPLVRLGAADALADGPPTPALRRLLLAVMSDPVRAVRITAAKGLAPVPGATLTDAERVAVARATDDYVAAQLLNGDRPEAHVNLGVLYAESGQSPAAERAYRTAIRLRPGFAEARVDLADLLRGEGREQEAEQVLRDALELAPARADVHHALGLLLVRTGRSKEALAELARASFLAPGNPHFGYAHALAQKSAGMPEAALATLERLHRAAPGDAEVIFALATFHRDLGHRATALAYAEQLRTLRPDDPAVARLRSDLASGPTP
jgi:predicted CXXCH cytochrome family protein